MWASVPPGGAERDRKIIVASRCSFHGTEHALDEIQRIGRMQVLRHALPISDEVQRQAVTDQYVERTAERKRLVYLGEDASRQTFAGIGTCYVLKDIGLCGSGEQQDASSLSGASSQQSHLIREATI